jgi:hypothetical protein
MGLHFHLFKTLSLIAGIDITYWQASEKTIYPRGNEMKGKLRKLHTGK